MTDSKITPDKTEDAQAAASTGAQEAVGQLLRETREKAGLDIADVARVLRISQKYLEALEDGRNADLPGAAYAIGFVRSYAEHLHLDGEEIVRRYKAQAEGVDAKTNLVFPKPIPDSGVPGAAVLGLGVIVAAVAYGVWYYNSQQADVVADRVEPVPEHMAAADSAPETPSVAAEVATAQVVEDSMAEAPERTPSVPEPTEPPVDETVSESAPESTPEPEVQAVEAARESADAAQAETEAADAAQQTVSEAVVPETAATETEAVAEDAVQAAETAETAGTESQAAPVQDAAEPAASAETAETAATAQTPDMQAAAEPAPDGPSRITVRARSNSWIQVRDETLDRLLFTRLLREGDEYEVPNRPGLHLMTGNAGALELVVDGEAIPALGDVGEVRRDVELDPEKLKAGTAVAE